MDLLNTIVLTCSGIIILCWALPQRYQVTSISVVTLLFLAWFAPLSLLILIISSSVSYWLIHQKNIRKSTSIIITLLQAVTIFAYFKISSVSAPGIAEKGIPFGFSYYSFRIIHYIIEVFKGQLKKHRFVDFLYFMFFLPTMLVGPINRFPDFLRDLYRRRWDSQMFSAGLERILYGYAKIVVVGNYLVSYKLKEFITRIDSYNHWAATYLDCIKFTLNAYFQFAGFSDVAIGLSMLMGFRIIENFNNPLLSVNINEFWKRWHISLSSWCKDYVFTPILSISRNPLFAIVCSMVILGLWHEFSLRYIVWGIIHGMAILVWHLYSRMDFAKQLNIKGGTFWKLIAIIITFHFFVGSNIIIKEDNFKSVFQIFKTLFSIN